MAAKGRSPTVEALAAGDQQWLDSMADAVVILAPVYDRGRRIVDFRVDYANAAASDLAGEQRGGSEVGFIVGRRFLHPIPPGAASLASLFRTVLRTGLPRGLDGLEYETTVGGESRRQVRDVRVSRRGDRLLVSLRDVTERSQCEDDVRRSEERLRALVDDVSDEALVTVDPGGNVASWNTGAQHIYGYRTDEIVGRHYSLLYPRGWLDGAHSESRVPAVAKRQHYEETWQVRKNGGRFWAGVSIVPTHSPDGELRGFSAVTRDLTEEAQHRRRELQLSVVRTLQQCSDIDEAADRILEITTCRLGATFGTMLISRSQDGHAESSSRHAFPRTIVNGPDPAGDPSAVSVWNGLEARVRSAGSLVMVPDLGEVGNPAQVAAAAALGLRSAIACPIAAGNGIVGVLSYFFETCPGQESLTSDTVTEIGAGIGQFVERVRGEAALHDEAIKMTELASTDTLTGLKNRREFDRLMGTIPRQPFAILAIDVDHLKRVNDEYGHEAGDLVLRTVGTTLALMLRGWDVIARVGGDEFAAILLDVDSAEAATAAQRLRAAMHLVPGPDDRSHISVGWASAPAGADPTLVWKTADECLYAAKHDGRDRVVGRDIEGGQQRPAEGPSSTELISDLVAGLPIHSVYQPIVDLNDGHVIGYEALARPQGFGPSDSVEALFEVAHRTGQIRDLDWLCRRAALSQAGSLPDGVLLFLNISVAALLDPIHDVDQMLLLLEWTGRAPDHLVLEIGEHENVRDFDRLRTVLASYRNAGIRFAIDDLGEGFATVELVAAARAEYVKLARSLTVSSVGKDSRAAIETALSYAHAVDATVIAEGVENEFVSDHIRQLGIPLGQGYGLGRPSIADALSDTRAAWNTRDTLRPLRPRNERSETRIGSPQAVVQGV